VRNSRQREAILRIVRGTACHPTAEWVYGQVKRDIPGISLGTVYRNLRLLTDSGELCSFEGAGGVSRYDGRTSPHYHFRCERCGALMDVEEPVDQDLDRRVALRTGLRVRCHVLEFRGYCTDCRQSEAVAETQD
jgi:Fur family peroxide stress response transcriptional regulator